MNKYDELCEFRMATIDDVELIMRFIYTYWSENHILALDKEFFLYEFAHENRINYFLAFHKKSQELEAIVGFYQYSKEMIPYQTDYSGSIWKVRDCCDIPMLGVELLRRLLQAIQPRVYVGNGSNPITAVPLQKKILGDIAGKHKHYYRLSDRNTYNIAVVNHKKILPIISDIQYPFIKYNTISEMYKNFNEEKFKLRKPYKDFWYINKRYFNHPIYSYKLLGIQKETITDTVLVCRSIEQNNSKVLRIVDILGDCEQIAYIGSALQKLLEEEEYEYIDIYERGISSDILEAAGLLERTEEDQNIIPNYFEPFVQKNVDIYYHIKYDDVYIFKADGDQDRPNHR